MQRLPAYAVPALCRWHAHFPLTPDGKVDSAALAETTHHGPNVHEARQQGGSVGKFHKVLVEVEVEGWSVDPDEDLIAGGLDRLTCVRLASRAGQLLGVSADIGDVLTYRALARLATELNRRSAVTSDRQLTLMRAGWWSREQLRPGDPAALVISGYELDGAPLDRAALTSALADLADRHQMLRTVVAEDDEGSRPAAHIRS